MFNPSLGPMGMDVRVDRAGQVKVLVFNINGEKVAEVFNQFENPGNYRASWDGRNQKGAMVGNGVYLLIIVQPSGHQTRKVIILR
jgi:flagellar hook assembly protein FlgD